MSFDSFVTTVRFAPGCLTICERPVSTISWSTWDDTTDGNAVDQLFASLPTPCHLDGDAFLEKFKAIRPSLFTYLQIQTDAARVTLHFLHKAIEAVLETGEVCQISTDGVRDAEALSFALPLLSAATPEELELAKDKIEFLISIS